MKLWPQIPERAVGHRIPARFRGLRARIADPDRLLVAFIDWLESTAPAPAAKAERDRRLLVEACIDVQERVPSPALAQRLGAALEDVGVTRYDGDGEAFDPERHRAVGSVVVADPLAHNRVAETQRVGYRDGAAVLRPPEVTVFVAAVEAGHD